MSARPSRSFALAAVAAGALWLTACSGGLRSDAEAPTVYTLRAAAPPAAAGAAGAPVGVLEVLRPVTAPGLDSDRLVVTRPDRSVDAYANARWAARVPVLVEALAVETLRGAGLARVVQDDAAPTPADLELRLSVRRFDAAYLGTSRAPVVHVTFDAVLSRRRDRAVLAAFTVERLSEARADRLGEVVLAFEQATQGALAELVDQSRIALRESALAPAPSAPTAVSGGERR